MMESKEKLEKRSAAQGLIHIGESASKNSARSCENNVAGSSSLHKFYKENRAKSKLLQWVYKAVHQKALYECCLILVEVKKRKWPTETFCAEQYHRRHGN